MDETDAEIEFDEKGVCNHCIDAFNEFPKYQFSDIEIENNLHNLSSKIKNEKKGEYDSILGLSGGVDSSYVAFLAMQMGLNPLCVHFDNGWNSDIAVKNIKNIINVTGFDLITYVIDWPEFRDLQRAFLKAGVIDIEMLTDHAIFASLFDIRKKYNIKTVLSGTNFATEHGLPKTWVWMKMDLKNITSIQNQFGNMKIKSFPTMSPLKWFIMRKFNIGGTFEEPLNKINFKKMNAMQILIDKFSWKYYGGKHYESVFTKFYQAYILPTKFGIDKRKSHLSSLIRNNELSRDSALEELKKSLYEKNEFTRDKQFVLKKLGFSESEFQKIILNKPVNHDSYPTIKSYISIIKKFKRFFKIIR